MKREIMRKIPFVFLLVMVLLSAGCVNEKNSAATPSPTLATCKAKCNGICYDPDKMTCCYGELADGKWSAWSDGCHNKQGDLFCGGKIYPNGTVADPSCCGGKLWDRSGNQWCCANYSVPKSWVGQGSYGGYDAWVNGGTVFDGTTQHCCNGNVVQGGPRKDWSTCGITCYNTATQTCYQDGIYSGPSRNCGNKLLCQSGMKCCDDKETGPTCYDPKTHYCKYTIR